MAPIQTTTPATIVPWGDFRENVWMALQDDLYKSLLEESKLYREKVSTIWLQKFTLLGAIIAFAATKGSWLVTGKNSSQLIVAAILSLPVIAVLLDIKLGEFGIHANVIDHFLKRHYREPDVLAEWQSTNWGVGKDTVDQKLVRIRSILTVAVTIIPTCIIAILSGLVIENLPGWTSPKYLMPIISLFCALYIAAGIVAIPLVLFRR